MTLFHSGEKNSPQFTQTAYKIGYYPNYKLTPKERKLIYWSRQHAWNKARIEQCLTEDKTEVYLPGEGVFEVHWIYNNIPTEQQWNLWKDGTVFLVNFRISPAMPGMGRVAILDLLTEGKQQS